MSKIGETIGAPSFYDDQLKATEFPLHNYAWLPDGQSFPANGQSGLVIEAHGAIPTQEFLRAHYVFGRFDFGVGSFGVSARLENEPLTELAAQGPILTYAALQGMTRLTLDVIANQSRTGFPLGFKWTDLNTIGIDGPFFALWSRVERPAITAGFSFHSVQGINGATMRSMALNVQSMPDATVLNLLREATILQGASETCIVFVNLGFNDRSETQPSVGPGGFLNGDSAAAYVDNFVALRQRIESVWTSDGNDLADLIFVVMPSHPITEPDDEKIVGYRDAMALYAQSHARIVVIDLRAITNEAEMLANGWFANPGSDRLHLTQSGYRMIGRRVITAIIAANYLDADQFPFHKSDWDIPRGAKDGSMAGFTQGSLPWAYVSTLPANQGKANRRFTDGTTRSNRSLGTRRNRP